MSVAYKTYNPVGKKVEVVQAPTLHEETCPTPNVPFEMPLDNDSSSDNDDDAASHISALHITPPSPPSPPPPLTILKVALSKLGNHPHTLIRVPTEHMVDSKTLS